MKQKNCFSILFIISSLLLFNCQSISGILATVDPNDHGHGDNHAHADPRAHTDAPPQPDPHPGSGAVHQPGWLFLVCHAGRLGSDPRKITPSLRSADLK